VYLESLDDEMTTAEHARAALADASGVNMQTWHGGSPSETQQRRDYAAAGVTVLPPPVADVESGINAVTEYLRTRRILFFDDLTHLFDEFARYKRAVEPDTGEVLEKIMAKETFHLLDSLRYLVLGHKHVVPLVAPLGLAHGGEDWEQQGPTRSAVTGDPTRDAWSSWQGSI